MATLTGREGTERADKVRAALRYLVTHDKLSHGDMSRIAEHFGVSRERVRQLKDEVLDEFQQQQLRVTSRVKLLPSNTPLGVSRG